MIITDSIFPAYTWLFAAGFPRARIAEFSTQLARLLAPLRPLTIYLNSDVATSLRRAVAQRGMPWLDGLVATMRTYTYSKTHPVRNMDDVIAFFEKVAQLSVELFADWPFAILVLDTTTTLDQVPNRLLQQFGLSERAPASMPTATELFSYVGLYVLRDGSTAAPPLEIRLVDGELIVDTYWPKGCRLVPEAPARFRLEGTNRRMAFFKQPRSERCWLTYTYGASAFYYDKTTEP